MFNLWNPTVTEDGCELDVTLANTPNFNQGSAELVRAFLDAWGITGEIESWTAEAIRTSYFSDYLGADEDWRDRWQRGFILRVRGRLAGPAETGRYEINQFVSGIDLTAEERGEGGPERCRAMIVAGKREPRETLDAVTIPKVIATVEAHGFARDRIDLRVRQAAPGERRVEPEGMMAWLKDHFPPGHVEKVIAKRDYALNPLHQVRVFLADVDFPRDDPTLAALCAQLKGEGLFVHRHALEFDAITPRG